MAAKKTILFELVLNRIDNKSKEGTKSYQKMTYICFVKAFKMGNAKFLDIRTKVQILLMYSHNCHLYIVCSYVLLSEKMT